MFYRICRGLDTHRLLTIDPFGIVQQRTVYHLRDTKGNVIQLIPGAVYEGVFTESLSYKSTTVFRIFVKTVRKGYILHNFVGEVERHLGLQKLKYLLEEAK